MNTKSLVGKLVKSEGGTFHGIIVKESTEYIYIYWFNHPSNKVYMHFKGSIKEDQFLT